LEETLGRQLTLKALVRAIAARLGLTKNSCCYYHHYSNEI